MRIKIDKFGISLVETLIAISIFALAALVASSMLFETVKMQKKSDLQNALHEDARLILQQLTNEIQKGTIDYEEYFSINVAEAPYYGMYYGVYGSRFYDPGKTGTDLSGSNPENLGIECSYPSADTPLDDCEVIYTLSTDLNTGQNPFNAETSSEQASSNAFCDNDPKCALENGVVDELYLIDSTGTKKTIIGRKKNIGEDFVIGLVRMKGYDIDQNGVIDTFGCDEGYTCNENVPESTFAWLNDEDIQELSSYDISLPSTEDLDSLFTPGSSHFVPFTPLRVNVQNLKFIINPIEDPYKGYAEKDTQAHPSVTIVMTLGLAKNAKDEYPGDLEAITVQTTVAAGVLSGIPSYPPTNDMGWVSNVPGVNDVH